MPVLGPITSVAKLKLNISPELDSPPFEIPKIDLNIELEKLAVGITRTQYQRLIELADGMSYMTRGVLYRKFRPHNTRKINLIRSPRNVPRFFPSKFKTEIFCVTYTFLFSFSAAYKGNAKIWWRFACNAIVETEVQRRKKDWSWNHIKKHLAMCREYADAYRTKITSKKVSNDVQQCIDRCEEQCDLFNLVLIRKRVNFEVEKSGILQKTQAQSSGWFSGWWGGGKTDDSDASKNENIRKLN